MAIDFRLLDSAGVQIKALPDVESFSLSPVLCDAGVVEFSYPTSGENWDALSGLDEFALAIYVDGEHQPRLNTLIKEIDGDDVSDAGVCKFTGFFNNGRLAEAVTYPKNWPTFDPKNPNLKFSSVTAGVLVGTLMLQAQSRGTLAGFTYSSFTGTHDSNGVPWNKTLSIEYAPQVDYLEVLRNLYAQQLCEFEVVGLDLRLYVPGTLSEDLTLGGDPLVFRKGRDLLDSPRKVSTRDLGTVMLGAGADGLYVERVNAPAVASRRRIEGKAAQGQVTDSGTLMAYTDVELERVVNPKMEKTHGLTIDSDGSPRPIVDFNIGDWAYSDLGQGQLERLRIKQWVLALNASGELTGSVTLNDLFAEREELLTRRIDGIVGGSTITGGSRVVNEVPSNLVDGLAPAAPASVAASSSAYMDNNGQTFAQITATWTAVTTNSNGTILDDLEGYRVEWKYVDQTGWTFVPQSEGELASWSPVAPGVYVNIRVQAFDRAGNYSAWSPQTTIFTGVDATPPEAPAAPLVDNYLGLIRIRYSGATASGAVQAPDFAGVEVHVSATAAFTPTSATQTDFLSGAGSSFYKAPSYLTDVFVRLIAVDHTGNKSAPTAAVSAQATQVVSPDIFDGAVGTAKLANLAVTTAKINDLAVNDAKIGSVSVGKLTAGIINAEVTVSGRLATALTGKRMELNGIGLQGWDAVGNQTVSIDGLNNLLTGVLKTALSGRRIEIGASGLWSEINFFGSDGRKSFVRAFTQATGTEAIQFGIESDGGANNLWNRINYNTSPNGDYAAYRSGVHEFIFDSTAPNEEGKFIIFQTSDKGAGAAVSRMIISPGTARYQSSDIHSFDVGPHSEAGWIEIRPHNIVDSNFRSPHIKFLTDSNGGGVTYGALIKFIVRTGAVNPAVQFRNVNDDGYENIEALSFGVASSIEGKNLQGNFADQDALAGIRATVPQRYTRKRSDGLVGATEIGLIAEEAPPEIVTPGGGMIDVYQMGTYMWSAIRQLSAEIEELRKGL